VPYRCPSVRQRDAPTIVSNGASRSRAVFRAKLEPSGFGQQRLATLALLLDVGGVCNFGRVLFVVDLFLFLRVACLEAAA